MAEPISKCHGSSIGKIHGKGNCDVCGKPASKPMPENETTAATPEGVASEAVKTEAEVAAQGVDTEKVAEEAVEAKPEAVAEAAGKTQAA